MTPAIARGSKTKASSSKPVADLAVHVSTTSADVPFERISIEAAVPSNDEDAAAFDEVFVIPGNPGVPGFYERFAKGIWTQMEGRARVSVIQVRGSHRERPRRERLVQLRRAGAARDRGDRQRKRE